MSHTRRLVGLREHSGRVRRALAAVLLLGLVVETVHHLTGGPHGQDLPLVDTWLHSALILVSSVVCARGARRRPPGPSRAAWWCFAAALLLFAVAEITWGVLYAQGGDVPTPNPTDALYLGTYPLFMAGLVLMVRARVLDVPWHRWLDGFVLVLIVATPGVLLLIEPALASAPLDPLGKTVTVAYPLGDVLLLGALLGSLPLMSWRLWGSWPWVGVRLLAMTVADAAYSLTAGDVLAHAGPYDFLQSEGFAGVRRRRHAPALPATRTPSRPSDLPGRRARPVRHGCSLRGYLNAPRRHDRPRIPPHRGCQPLHGRVVPITIIRT